MATAGSGWFASSHGCTLHEGFVNPCVVDGTDYGETLYQLGMMGWLMLFTLPLAAALICLWVVIEIGVAVKRRRQRQRPLSSH